MDLLHLFSDVMLKNDLSYSGTYKFVNEFNTVCMSMSFGVDADSFEKLNLIAIRVGFQRAVAKLDFLKFKSITKGIIVNKSTDVLPINNMYRVQVVFETASSSTA